MITVPDRSHLPTDFRAEQSVCSDRFLALARTARMAAAGIYKAMVDARAPSDESYYYDIAAFSLAALVRTELKQLESAQKTDEVGKLRTEYAQILAMKEPKPDPDSEIILTLSCASPGPLQRIDACYVMKMPEEARSRFLKILEKMRSDAVAAATNDTVMAGTARIPKAMVDHIYHVVAYERAQTAEYTQNQYFPAAGLPMLEKSVQVTQDAYDALAKGKSDPAAAATLAECAPLIARLKKVVDNARTEANKVPAASNPATTATSDANTPDWRGARIITGEHLRVCTLVNEFFEAMAEENAARLRSILAGGANSQRLKRF